MTDIHQTAIVDPATTIGKNVAIGPFSIIGPKVNLHDSVKIHSHVVIDGDTTIGERTEIFPFASIGHPPQDISYTGEDSRLVIGENNVIREYVTMNPGTQKGDNLTSVGDNGFFMASSHVAHDCKIGNHVVFANNATIGGHCRVEDFVILGGLAGVHQFVRIGAYAFIGGMSGIDNDVIPFGMAIGLRNASLTGLNVVGLKRQGFSRERIHNLRKAYRLIFSPEGTLSERLEDAEKMFSDDPDVMRVINFINSDSDRPLCVPRNSG